LLDFFHSPSAATKTPLTGTEIGDSDNLDDVEIQIYIATVVNPTLEEEIREELTIRDRADIHGEDDDE
jgi:hypothetical protein